jgi:peptide methionine sulfoxide reductase msrA/msrB
MSSSSARSQEAPVSHETGTGTDLPAKYQCPCTWHSRCISEGRGAVKGVRYGPQGGVMNWKDKPAPGRGLRMSRLGMAGLAAASLLAVAAAGLGQNAEKASEPTGGEVNNKVTKSEPEWKKVLTPEQYQVLRQGKTEAPFTGKYWNSRGTGMYVCPACSADLFRSSEKFDSGCGWPSFWQAVPGAIEQRPDNSLGMQRIEVRCGRCGSHLGHVFNDGPEPTGMRYCINSAALSFRDLAAPAAASAEPKLETATFGAGCFWCTEAALRSIDGVKSVKVGYMGGHVRKPTYQDVCGGDTGHAEVAQIVYDPAKASYAKLLEVFWKVHDPTSLNRQGADVGTQYRSAIFYHDEQQKEIARESRAAHQKELGRRIVTEVVPATEFYEAENYHQDYYRSNPNAPYCRMVIAPKLEKLKGK